MVFAAEITTDSTYTIFVNFAQKVRDANIDVVCKSLGESILSVRTGTVDCEGPAEAIKRIRAGTWDYEELSRDKS